MDDRSTATVLGRKIGTYTGWDVIDFNHVVFYDFKSEEEIDLPPGDLNVDLHEGLFLWYDESGKEVLRKDIIELLRNIPRAEKE